MRPYPLAPLTSALGKPPAGILAARLGVSRRTVCRWKRQGLTECQADQAAVRAGLHPGIVWSEWWSSAACVTQRPYEGGDVTPYRSPGPPPRVEPSLCSSVTDGALGQAMGLLR